MYDRHTFFSSSDDIILTLSLGLFIVDCGCRKGRLASSPMRLQFFSCGGRRSLGLLYGIKELNDYVHEEIEQAH